MSEFIVEAGLSRLVWHQFRMCCARSNKAPETVVRELIERFVREDRLAKKTQSRG